MSQRSPSNPKSCSHENLGTCLPASQHELALTWSVAHAAHWLLLLESIERALRGFLVVSPWQSIASPCVCRTGSSLAVSLESWRHSDCVMHVFLAGINTENFYHFCSLPWVAALKMADPSLHWWGDTACGLGEQHAYDWSTCHWPPPSAASLGEQRDKLKVIAQHTGGRGTQQITGPPCHWLAVNPLLLQRPPQHSTPYRSSPLRFSLVMAEWQEQMIKCMPSVCAFRIKCGAYCLSGLPLLDHLTMKTCHCVGMGLGEDVVGCGLSKELVAEFAYQAPQGTRWKYFQRKFLLWDRPRVGSKGILDLLCDKPSLSFFYRVEAQIMAVTIWSWRAPATRHWWGKWLDASFSTTAVTQIAATCCCEKGGQREPQKGNISELHAYRFLHPPSDNIKYVCCFWIWVWGLWLDGLPLLTTCVKKCHQGSPGMCRHGMGMRSDVACPRSSGSLLRGPSKTRWEPLQRHFFPLRGLKLFRTLGHPIDDTEFSNTKSPANPRNFQKSPPVRRFGKCLERLEFVWATRVLFSMHVASRRWSTSLICCAAMIVGTLVTNVDSVTGVFPFKTLLKSLAYMGTLKPPLQILQRQQQLCLLKGLLVYLQHRAKTSSFNDWGPKRRFESSHLVAKTSTFQPLTPNPPWHRLLSASFACVFWS